MLIEYSNRAKKFLKSLDSNISLRIIERIEILMQNPVPSDVKFIGRHKGEKVFRYRIGDYRALYKIKESEKVILIINLDKRERVYE